MSRSRSAVTLALSAALELGGVTILAADPGQTEGESRRLVLFVYHSPPLCPERTLEVLRLDEGRWTLLDVHADEDVVRAEPFDAVLLDLSQLWEGPTPQAPAPPSPPASAGPD